MNEQQLIPHGDQTVTIELTLKEAIALSGFRFNNSPQLVAGARRKIKRSLDRAVYPETDKLHYHALGL